ncbi:DALR anticodon-binding domain-containing protein 3 [Drosophila erecta]|uniref:DALR anticodon binding domain-containing protein n=1 Tax=Drosophila erecta TaxID=7220 RepID=B3NTJ3_DROER|nr:DALR anticodon-binding domain-containing protein 3 [Drosophila erecta]EDV46997.1 uncharacterized protein Dere_GG17890 [Drosophila erecta]
MNCNPMLQFTQQLVEFLTKPETLEVSGGDAAAPLPFKKCGELIRYHNEDLAKQGDLSLAAISRYWEKYVKDQGLKLRHDADQLLPGEKERLELIEQSGKWRFPLVEITVLHKERYSLRFERRPLIAHVLNSVLTLGEDYGRPAKNTHLLTLCLQLQANAGATDGCQDLRHYRLQQLYKILLRLVGYSSWRLVEPNDQQKDTLCVNVELEKCCKRLQPRGHVCLVSGPVLEPVKKTATGLTVDEYLELRCTHMRLMAMHRSGIRPAGMSSLDTLMRRLGAAAVIVDLFEVRHASAVTVVRNGLGICKGAAYILYNSARLETLLRTFANQVKAGVYEKLPPLEEIDLSVLEDDIDWQLIYGYLFTFPELMASLMDQLAQGHCGIHLLLRYIENLAGVFSRFYRLKKVLVQKRDQLMPTLYARIYLIMAVRQVLNKALAVLGIEPVDYV